MTSTVDQFAPPAGVPIAPLKIEKTGGMPIGNAYPHKGRYYDPNTDTSYQRVSNLLKNVDGDRYGLERWFERMTALGLAARSDLLLGVAALGPDGDKNKLNDLCEQAKNHAGSRAGANKGTALHAATERLDRGEHIDNIILPPPFDADLRAYRDLCFSAGFIKDPNMIERSVGIPELDYMGTLDRAKSYRSVNGELSIVDVKTEKDPTYNWLHIAAQLACYANATHIWHDGRLIRMDMHGVVFNTAVGYVVHVRDGAANLYAVDLVAGWRVVQLALALRAEHKGAKTFAIHMPIIVTPPPAADLVSTAVAQSRANAQTNAVADSTVVLCSCLPGGKDPWCPIHDAAVTGQPDGFTVATSQNMTLVVDPAATLAATPPEASVTISGTSDAPTAPPAEVDMTDMLLREIEQADSTARLAELYEIAQGYPGLWAAVELHAMRRGQIVACKHRSMHNPTTTKRCACGWTPEARA
jgi:hypothetical protein